MRGKIFLLGVFMLGLVFAFSAPYGLAIGGAVEEAVLRGNWQEVFKILEKDDTKAGDPVARLIMGHAALATNRNNASMLLFLSVKEKADLKRWLEWTELLLHRNPQNPFALYLSADAKARLGRLKEAEKELTQALEIKEDFALAHNARGVIRMLTKGDSNEALDDFISATRTDPHLANAYANLGAYYILIEAADGALKAFNEAIKLDPDFALAYNGRGCAHFGRGRFEEAARDFSTALRLSPVLAISEANLGFAFTYASRLASLGAMKKKPGTTLEFRQQYLNNLKRMEKHYRDIMGEIRKGQDFLKKIENFHHLSSDQIDSLGREYGPLKVIIGVAWQNQRDLKRLTELREQVEEKSRKIDVYNRWIMGSAMVDTLSSLSFSAFGLSKAIKEEGWRPFLKEAGWSLGKAGLQSLARQRTMETLVGALSNPFASTLSSLSKLSRYIAEDKRYAALTEIEIKSSQAISLATAIRWRQERLNEYLENLKGPSPAKRPFAQIPRFYTSTDRPLPELSALASMVNKEIRPKGDSLRSALIVSEDPFRGQLLQAELLKYGILSRQVPLSEAMTRAFKADIILGIKGGSLLGDENRRRLVPPPPGGSPPPPPPSSWDWGKRFIPSYPKGSPGGITTEELARTFVDEGYWPVKTSFSLFYPAKILFAQAQTKRGGEL